MCQVQWRQELTFRSPLGTAWNIIESMACTLQGRCIWNSDWVLCFFNNVAISQQRLPVMFTEDVQVLHVVCYDTSMTFMGKCAIVDLLAWMEHLKGLNLSADRTFHNVDPSSLVAHLEYLAIVLELTLNWVCLKSVLTKCKACVLKSDRFSTTWSYAHILMVWLESGSGKGKDTATLSRSYM